MIFVSYSDHPTLFCHTISTIRNKTLNERERERVVAFWGVRERISRSPPTQRNRSRRRAAEAGNCRRSLSVPASHHGATSLCFIGNCKNPIGSTKEQSKRKGGFAETKLKRGCHVKGSCLLRSVQSAGNRYGTKQVFKGVLPVFQGVTRRVFVSNFAVIVSIVGSAMV